MPATRRRGRGRAARDAEGRHRGGVREELLVGTAADDLTEQIEGAEGRGQREVEPALERAGIPLEGEAGRGAAQAGPVGRQCRHGPRQVVGGALVDHVDASVSRAEPCTVAAASPTRMYAPP